MVDSKRGVWVIGGGGSLFIVVCRRFVIVGVYTSECACMTKQEGRV